MISSPPAMPGYFLGRSINRQIVRFIEHLRLFRNYPTLAAVSIADGENL
jgi:hypothetical protein